VSPVVVHVATRGGYEVRIGRGVLRELTGTLRAYSASAVLSDTNVEPLHVSKLGLEPQPPLLALPPGEDSKRMHTLEQVLDFMVETRLDRDSCLIALGGGVVGDLGGLAASLYQRGIAVVQCPTTLLAQVDSSVGGKTAINLEAGKNLAGTFHQPAEVLADTETLSTLTDTEYRSGLGEVLKTALIAGTELIELLERSVEAIVARDPDALCPMIEACVRTKGGVVARDEREGGERKKLNLGHTFGHAIEHAAGYGKVPHGLAVAAGIGVALECSRRLGLLRDADLPLRVSELAQDLGLPSGLDALRAAGLSLPADVLLRGMRHDKKGAAGKPRLVLPVALGEIELDVEADDGVIESLLGA